MITFLCSCGHKYDVPNKYAGKKVRCKHCNNTSVVPTPNTDSPRTTPPERGVPPCNECSDPESDNNQESNSSPAIPAWTWYLFGTLGISCVGFLLWVFAIRDTWEIDHYEEIFQTTREIKSFVNDKNFNSAQDKYNQLNSLIGGRTLNDDVLQQAVISAQNEYETLGQQIRRQAELVQQEKRKRELEEQRKEALAEEQRQMVLAEAERERKNEEALEEALRQKQIAEKRRQQRVADAERERQQKTEASEQQLSISLHDAARTGLARILYAPSTARIHASFHYKKVSYAELTNTSKQLLDSIRRNPGDSDYYLAWGDVDAQNRYGATLTQGWIFEIAVTTYGAVALDGGIL